MKLSNQEALGVLEALTKLDACKFGADGGRLRYRIARNIRALQSVREDFESALQKVFKELAGDKPALNQMSEEAVRFGEMERRLRRELIEVNLFPVDFGELKVDDNNIAGSTLAALEPILTGTPLVS